MRGKWTESETEKIFEKIVVTIFSNFVKSVNPEV